MNKEAMNYVLWLQVSLLDFSYLYNETRIVFAEFDASLRKWIKGENQTKRWQS